MGLVEDFDELLVDHLYEQVVKPCVGDAIRAKDASTAIPERSGNLKRSTRVYLAARSDADTAIVVIESDPDQTAPYNTFRKNFGTVDYANFTNARGSSEGWFDRLVDDVCRVFQ